MLGRCPDPAVRQFRGGPLDVDELVGCRWPRRAVRAQPRPATRERSGKGEPAGSAAGAGGPPRAPQYKEKKN
jgi:hypothetical protein